MIDRRRSSGSEYVRVYGQTLKERADGYVVDGVGDDSAIERLSEAGYRVERHEDLVAPSNNERA